MLNISRYTHVCKVVGGRYYINEGSTTEGTVRADMTLTNKTGARPNKREKKDNLPSVIFHEVSNFK
jgi:hypothetical protein